MTRTALLGFPNDSPLNVRPGIGIATSVAATRGIVGAAGAGVGTDGAAADAIVRAGGTRGNNSAARNTMRRPAAARAHNCCIVH